MKLAVILAAALAAAPAMAQVTPPASADVAAAPLDPQRLAAAAVTVDHVWPLGTYERMMRGSMEPMTEKMM
jgi:hypothetical protein